MSLYETRHAEAIIRLLEDAEDIGVDHVVIELWPAERQLHPTDVHCFERAGDALDRTEQLAGDGLPYSDDHPVWYMRAGELIEKIQQSNGLINQEAMNYNNLENLKEEMTKLGFGKKVAEEMQRQMERGGSEFQLHDRVMGHKGQSDLTLYFKQSSQSENYYLNKYDVRLLNGKPLAEGDKYLVFRPNEQEPGKQLQKSFDKVEDALTFFKAQSGDALLASGKDAARKTDLARMEGGQVNYVEKDFARTYRNPGISQTVFVERGKGFTAAEAVNLIEGRAVYKDDLVKLGGEPYKAWIKLDMDTQKDRYHNFPMLQYHVPTYGFELEKVLEKFNVKEMADEKKQEQLLRSLEQGNRPLVTVVRDGKEEKLFMETSPRYSQVNFFREDGKPEKREQFLKAPEKEKQLEVHKDKAQAKQEAQGLSV